MAVDQVSVRESLTQVLSYLHFSFLCSLIQWPIIHYLLECACIPEEDESECPIGACECDGQFRMNHDCSEAR